MQDDGGYDWVYQCARQEMADSVYIFVVEWLGFDDGWNIGCEVREESEMNTGTKENPCSPYLLSYNGKIDTQYQKFTIAAKQVSQHSAKYV